MQATMVDMPVEIADKEKIVRAIKVPSHVNRSSKLKPAAFRSAPGTDEVSVMRHDFLGTECSRTKAKTIGKEAYVGLAVIRASQIREIGSSVTDSRVEFWGHAHISHGIIVERDEPLQSALNMQLTERCRAIARAATYHPDPEPNSVQWLGGDL
jgi:hypothetical protein